jgi:Spy/CpxP family protein refolding chaperone
MKRITIWSIAVVLVLTTLVIVRADTQGRHGWGGHEWHHSGLMGYWGHELNLNQAQKAEIHTLWQAERPVISAHIHEFLAENKEMHAIAAQGNPDPGKVQQIADRQATTIAALLVEKEQLQSRIYMTVLNSEQRAKADALQKKWESRLDHAADRLGTPSAEN